MSLSVIIVSWNTRELLQRCLKSVQREVLTTPQIPTEVFVVDNASGDGSSGMVAEMFPQVKLLQNYENVGFARANNQAIRAGRADFVLLLNSDAELLAGSLTKLVDFMRQHAYVGAVGARLLNSDGTLQHGCHPMLTPDREFWRLIFLDRFWPRSHYPLETWDEATPRPVEVIKGACLLLRRAALEQVGLLDEQYHMYTEEVDLCYRLAAAGWSLWYMPEAVVIHHGGASSRQVAHEMYLQLYRSKVQFYRKFGGACRVDRFKHFVRVAYWPRLLIHGIGAAFSPSQAARARTCHRLLAELPSM